MSVRPRPTPRLVAALLGLCVALMSTASAAASSAEVSYTLAQVYSGALRYLRIDLGYKVTEKDPDAAYLLFRYEPSAGKSSNFGAIELVVTGSRVRVVVKLPELPSYHETVLKDGLLKKLREDYGVDEPRRPPKAEDEPIPPTDKQEPDGPQPERTPEKRLNPVRSD